MDKERRHDAAGYYCIATNAPDYQFGRRNGLFNHFTNFALLHQSWARSADEISQKISNWGHKTDFDVHAYFDFWKTVSQQNYNTIENFHPIVSTEWQGLGFQPAKDIQDLISQPATRQLVRFSAAELSRKNSLWRSRYNKLKSILRGKR